MLNVIFVSEMFKNNFIEKLINVSNFYSGTEPMKGDEPIMFTKTKPEIKFRQQGFPLEFNEPLNDRAYLASAPVVTKVSVPQRELDSIHMYQDRFNRFLRKSSHHVTGRFNPWKLMEE